MHVLHVVARKTGFYANAAVLAQVESLKKYISVDLYVYNASSLNNYFLSALTLKKHIRDNKYDLIHAHFSRSAFLCLLVSGRVPVIVSYMGTDVLGENLINRYMRQYVSKHAVYQIVKSKEMGNFFSGDTSLSIIPNGVSFERFKPIDKIYARDILGLSQVKMYILFAADPMRKEKNYELAKSAVKILKSDSKQEVELLTLYNQPHERVCSFMNASDVVLLTSIFEGSPNIIKEAMACNCPIVSTDVGDVREHIEGVKGCYIAEFCPNNVAAKITKAFSNCEKTDGREKIRHLDIDKIAVKIIEIYKRIIN